MSDAGGFTVFHFDFNPKLTRRDLTLGQAVRLLMRVTGTRITWWRCPVRGLAIEYRRLPTSGKSYDRGETYRIMSFCDLPDEVAAKKALTLDLLLTGIELYRALPTPHFDETVRQVTWLLQAPPSVGGEVWKAQLAKLPRKVQDVIRTHEPELRTHLLGQKYDDPSTGPREMTARIRLEA